MTDMPLVDAHCHFWQLARGDYDWLTGNGGPLAPIRRDFLPHDYPAERRVIAVQAASTLAETDYLLALAERHPFIAGVVGWVDLADPDAVAALEERVSSGLLRAVRPMLQDIADTGWLLSAPRPEVLAALVRLGLCFDALVTERHLSVLQDFVQRNPDLPVVIDHGAKPQPGDKTAWAQAMQRLARNPRVHCKLSGLLTELSAPELAKPDGPIGDIAARLLEWFGPERLIWGSDWPVLTLAAGFDDWVDLTGKVLVGLSAAERAAVLGGNAVRFYGLDLAGRPRPASHLA